MLNDLLCFAFLFQGQQLKFIEEDLLEQQIKLHSERIISDLEKVTAELKTESQDDDLAKYEVKVLFSHLKHILRRLRLEKNRTNKLNHKRLQ